MYYPQNTQKITTVILSFDDIMTELSKLRFNYYRRLCKLYNQQLNEEEYFNQASSFQTMYLNSPIPTKLISTDTLKAKVEEDLYLYCSHHGIKVRDGFDELFDLFKSKKIQIIFTSSHPKKYTQPLFQLMGTRYLPQSFIYDDLSIYETLKENAGQILVLTSNLATLKLANRYRYNVIFYETLQKINEEIHIRSLATIRHLMEAINLILDPHRKPSHHYLLIDEDTPMDETMNLFRKLYLEPETLNALNSIYESEKETMPPIKKMEPKIHEVIEEKKEQEIEEKEEQKIEIPYLESSEDLFDHTIVFDPKLLKQKEETLDEDTNFTLEPLDKIEGETSIDSIINELNDRHSNTQFFSKEELQEFGMTEDDLYKEEIEIEEDEPTSLLEKLGSSFFYAFIDTIIYAMLALALAIGFYDWIFKEGAPFTWIADIHSTLQNIAHTIFGWLPALIHNMVPLSESFQKAVSIFCLFFVVLWAIIFLMSYFREKE